MKNPQVFLGLLEKWGHRTNCCPHDWGDRQADTKNPTYQSRKPQPESLHRNHVGEGNWDIRLCSVIWKDISWVKNNRQHEWMHLEIIASSWAAIQ